MKYTFKGLAVFAVLLLVGAGCAPAATPAEKTGTNTAGDTTMEDTKTGDAMMEKTDGEAMMEEDGAMMEKDGDAMMEKDGAMMEKDDAAMIKNDSAMMEKQVLGSYTEYTPDAIANAETENVVLFFHAKWCSSCKALNKDIGDSLSDIPEDLTLINVDYDTHSDLKKKYGVTYQHTMVQVDKDGNLIKKWSGGNTLESVVKQVQ